MTTPDKIYATILNGHVTMAWSDWREDKTDVEYIRADIHKAEVDALKAENAALHAECDRLTALLQWEQNRRERIGTHGDECWKWGPAHYECASRETERLTAMLGPQKVLSADEVTEPGFYQWRHLDGDPWTVTEVVVNETPELRQYYFGSEEDLELMGQFIGPIKMRGVGDA